jgi:hypothetical protein
MYFGPVRKGLDILQKEWRYAQLSRQTYEVSKEIFAWTFSSAIRPPRFLQQLRHGQSWRGCIRAGAT